MKAFKFALFVSAIVATLALFVDAASATLIRAGRSAQDESKIAPQRVLLIGDETVVDSALQPYGFTNELRKVMAEAELDVEIVPLGKRGATFADWRALIADSYGKNEPTDVDGVFIKDELDKGADLIVLFLGFNDARKPSFQTFDFSPNSNALGYASLGKDAAEGLKIVDVAAQLRENVAGLVDDLQKRVPGCRVVSSNQIWENRPVYPGKIADAVYFVQQETGKAMKAKNCDVLGYGILYAKASRSARFNDEEISTTSDGFHLNEYGSQLVTCGTLLALAQNYKFQAGSPWLYSGYWTRETLPRLVGNLRYLEPFKTRASILQNAKDGDSIDFTFLSKDENFIRNMWSSIATRYYVERVDRRLRDFGAPGFTLFALCQQAPRDADEVCVKVLCVTREIEADQPLEGVPEEEDEPAEPPKIDPDFYRDPIVLHFPTQKSKIVKTPKIEIVSCGNLRFDKINRDFSTVARGENEDKRGFYQLDFYGKPEDIPVDVTLAVDGVQKTVRIFRRGECAVSGVFPLEHEFSSLADYPQEKTIASVDYATLAGHNPVVYRPQKSLALLGAAQKEADAPLPPWKTPNPEETWTSVYSAPQLFTSFKDGESDPDPNWFNLATYLPNTPFSGVYVVRVFDSPKDQSATLKLGVKGYKTHVIERVYLNGAAVFTGELNVDDPEMQEVSVPTKVKKGRNVMVARVDRTQWDWVVGFTLLDEEGRPLKDLSPWQTNDEQ